MTMTRPTRATARGPGQGPAETDEEVKARFGRKNIMVRENVASQVTAVQLQGLLSRRLFEKIPCDTLVYVPKSRLVQAMNTNQPLKWMREGVRVVKIISEKKRRTRAYQDHEILLWHKYKWNHQNIVPFYATDPQHCWITMPLVGIDMATLLVRMHESDCSCEQIPELFIWNLTKDVMAGLAFLHCGVSPDQATPPQIDPNWPSLALDINAAGIQLQPVDADWGYPRAILADFSSAVEKPANIGIVDWMPARLDMENAAAVLHELAHGRPFSQHTQTRANGDFGFCDCFTSPAVPDFSFLKSQTAPPSKRIRNTIDSISYATGPHQLTSADVLSRMNVTNFTRRIFKGTGKDPRAKFLPHEIEDLIDFGGMVWNDEIRESVPELRYEYGPEHDIRERESWTTGDLKVPPPGYRYGPGW